MKVFVLSRFSNRSAAAGALVLLLAAPPAGAIDLLEAYQRALSEDATFQAARADTAARREAVPQARAQLLPNLSANLQQSKNETDSKRTLPPLSSQSYDYTSRNYALTLRQPLYRKYNFALYEQAKSDVAGAEATLAKSEQDLALRIAGLYFEALMARTQHALTLAQKDALALQLQAARRTFEKGQGTLIDIDDAQARYDMSVAQELESRQNVVYTRRQLGIAVNQPVDELAELQPARLDLAPIQPASVEEWIAKGEENSPELQAMRASLESGRQELEKARAGHYPTVDLIAQRSLSESENNNTIGSRYQTSLFGLQVNVPLYAGGYAMSQTRQAHANIEKLEQLYEARRRDIELQVHKTFLSLSEGVAKILAQQQAERSAERALASNQKGLPAGTRSQVDVLNAQQQLTNARRDLALARYQYIVARIRLQGLVGTLNEHEIRSINAWLAPPAGKPGATQ